MKLTNIGIDNANTDSILMAVEHLSKSVEYMGQATDLINALFVK